MHRHTLDRWQHPHRFHIDHGRSEQSTYRVIALTLVMMVIEISAGLAFGSMALLADGWHMGTHAVALGITALAYYFARRHADNPRFTFGTGKVGELGGFTSAVVLAVVAILMAAESLQRLVSPHAIHFNEAIAVAVVGLIVNVISAFMLQDRHPMTTPMSPARGTATTTISGRPTCTCWPTPSHRCWPSSLCLPARPSAGCGWTLSWASWAR